MTDTPPAAAFRLAEIAHELRAPLGGFDAMLDMLGTTALDEGQLRILAALKASAAHLRGIANEILGAPAGAPAGESASLGALLATLDTASTARARPRGLAFAVELAESRLQSAEIEAGPLRQVLENLIDNAFRLTEAGRITLQVARGAAGRIVFTLTDDGPGLSAETAERLIRQGGGIEGRAGGAGIGLTISGRIVAERGGRLTGGPRPEGRGAAFSFDWPDGRAPVASNPRGACLVVDDHPASRLVLKTILAASGRACLEAASAAEALRVIAERRPSLVLTDMNMPGGGAALARGIAALPEAARPAILVVSADEIEPGDALHALIDGAIRKPVAVRAVLEAVAAIEAARETASEAA